MSKKNKIPKLSKVYKELIIAGGGRDLKFREHLMLKEKIPTGMHDSIIEEVKQYLGIG